MQKRIAIVAGLVIIAVATFILMQPEPGPCRQVRAACEAQGFKRGRTPAERRSFQENCFRPLLEGQVVGDIKIEPDVLRTCRQRQMEKRRQRKGPGGPVGPGGRGGGREEPEEV